MKVQNRSNRTSLYSRAYNCVPSMHSFLYQSQRRQAYQQRLYFEFLYTEKLKGQTFFYTLTYNDKSIPYYKVGDMPLFACFDYKHIQWLTHSILDTVLHRKYGSRLRYFCACETGDGKGKRGVGSNPHYHLIFFVQPIIKDGVPQYDGYKPISPVVFRSMVRDAWQGTHKYIKFQDAKFGIAKEGDMLGLVSSTAALKYVSKYVTKDSLQKDWENIVFEYWKNKVECDGVTNEVLLNYYKYWSSSVFDNTSVPLHHLFYTLGLDKYNCWRHMTNDPNPDRSYFRFITRYCDDLNAKVAATQLNDWFVNIWCNQVPLFQLRKFINEHSGKPRCSKSLGEYGLKFVLDLDCFPSFSIPSVDGYDIQKVSLYYYRKLYYNVYKCDVTGNVLYRLNQRGIEAHVNSFPQRVTQFFHTIKESLSIVSNQNLVQFEQYRKNDMYRQLSNDDDLLKKYVYYKHVYEFRCFNIIDFSCNLFSPDSILSHYRDFITNDSYLFDWDYSTVYTKRMHSRQQYLDYSVHEEIKPFIRYFDFLDKVLDHVNEYRSECSKQRFNEVADLRKKHNQTKYNSLT